jgi:hypothetical protein
MLPDEEKKSNKIPVADIDLENIPDSLSKIYSDWQGNPSEKLLVITNDGKLLTFGSSEQHQVKASLADVIRQLAYNNKKLSDVAYMIHNHNKSEKFSPIDKKVYKTLKGYGFSGKFQAYYPETKRLKTLKDKEDLEKEKLQIQVSDSVDNYFNY